MLRLRLSTVSAQVLEGTYNPGGVTLPDRMRYLLPEAAASVERMAAENRKVRASDVFRDAAGSLLAKQRNPTGAKPPAFSAHNYGLAMDIDYAVLRKRWGNISKAELDSLMDGYGWVCHRIDHKLDSESWHYNYLDLPGTQSGERYRALVRANSAPAVEQRIQDLYGTSLVMSKGEIQTALRQMHFYNGAIDGKLGPLSRQALLAFQRAWGLPPSGNPTSDTQRTLAYVSATKDVVP